MRITRSRPIAKVFESLGISDDPLGLHRRQGASALIRQLFSSHDATTTLGRCATC